MDSNTPLHFAVRHKLTVIAKLLADNGAKLEIYNNSLKTPLEYITSDTREKFKKMLKEEDLQIVKRKYDPKSNNYCTKCNKIIINDKDGKCNICGNILTTIV